MNAKMIRLVLSHVRSANAAMRAELEASEVGAPSEDGAVYREGYWTGMGQALALLLEELGASEADVRDALLLAAFEKAA